METYINGSEEPGAADFKMTNAPCTGAAVHPVVLWLCCLRCNALHEILVTVNDLQLFDIYTEASVNLSIRMHNLIHGNTDEKESPISFM